jgi:ring-1,2-phenylacetyl-CoA epoxidase subunit PaaA
MAGLAAGTEEQKAMAQDSLNRWWWPSLMMFGPPDADSVHSAQSTAWGIKRVSNDDLRQRFVDTTVPQAEHIGLIVPDPDLTLDEATGQYSYGAIDWAEFWKVVGGDGPCNKDRMNQRRASHTNGAWVREAAEAHALRRAAQAEQEISA